MFGMSFVELSIVAIIALLLLGPDQLPGVARTIGKGLRDLRKASDDLKSTLNTELGKLESEMEAPPKPRRAAITAATDAANAVIETAATATMGTTVPAFPVLGAGLLSLDQARQAAAPVHRLDPGALRAQARAQALVDPGAARAAARNLASNPPAPTLASDSSIHAQNAELLVEAKVASIEAKINAAAAQADINAMQAVINAPSETIAADTNVDIADATALILPQAPVLPPDELKPLRTYVNNAPVLIPNGAPAGSVAHKKPDES
jgi:sec-independent protein translocase protein TatB